jgi:hypothetical protein
VKRPGRARPAPARPRPDHGAVWVQPWTGAAAPFWRNSWEDETGPLWRASWQDGERLLESPPSPREQAVAWAFGVPAAWRLVRSGPDEDWVELPPP